MRALLALRRMAGGRQQLQPGVGVFLAAMDFIERQLAVGDGIVTNNTLRHLAIGDSLDFQRVHAAEISDLGERECGFFNQPHRSGLGHQGQGHQQVFLWRVPSAPDHTRAAKPAYICIWRSARGRAGPDAGHAIIPL